MIFSRFVTTLPGKSKTANLISCWSMLTSLLRCRSSRKAKVEHWRKKKWLKLVNLVNSLRLKHKLVDHFQTSNSCKISKSQPCTKIELAIGSSNKTSTHLLCSSECTSKKNSRPIRKPLANVLRMRKNNPFALKITGTSRMISRRMLWKFGNIILTIEG